MRNKSLLQEESTQDGKLKNTRNLVLLSNLMIIAVLVWQVMSSYWVHRAYQESLMDSVTDRILSDYQAYFQNLRLQSELFQKTHAHQLQHLFDTGSEAPQEDYMALLQSFRAQLPNSRLYAFVDQHGKGSLSHITGNFLPQCEMEIQSTLADGMQEQLFLHRSKTSVHFDILQPLNLASADGHYFFTSFGTDELESLLTKYQLPHQELFLLRADNLGKIDLSSELSAEQAGQFVMTSDELESFSYQKPIPGTRWQIAVRLDPAYANSLIIEGLSKAVIIWIILSGLSYGFYQLQKTRFEKYVTVAQQATFTAKHDKLTELLNRTHFQKELGAFLSNNARDTNVGVVLQVDIDQFQLINNSYGYTFGDQLLAKISSRLGAFLPPEAIISRLGNDEFAVLLTGLPHAKCEALAEHLRGFIQDLSPSPDERNIHVTACVGAVILDKEQQDAEQILVSLSQSVSIAKAKGRNRIQLYQSNDVQLLKHAEEMRVIQNIEQAFQRHQFVLYRQRIIDIQGDQEVPHYEVLIRLKDNQGGILEPGGFIGIAEKYGLINKVDYWVLEQTCSALSIAPTKDTPSYSINISGKTIAEPEAVAEVKRIIRQFDVDPKRIGFEITETAAISNMRAAVHFIEELRTLGCRFYLDDFGSGLSSFAYLQQLPVDVIKIDGSFVSQITVDPVSHVLVENIQRIAQAMEKDTIAEWVESEQTAELLKTLGVNGVQGYHYHKPELWYPIS